MVLVLFTSLNCYASTLRLVHYALILAPAFWKSSNTNAKLMAFALSLSLDPIFGIHSHKTLDIAQTCPLLKPYWKPSTFHSISATANINTQFLLCCEDFRQKWQVWDWTVLFQYMLVAGGGFLSRGLTIAVLKSGGKRPEASESEELMMLVIVGRKQ